MSRTVKRVLMSIVGVSINAVCVGFFKLASFGVDPFQALMSGLDELIPIEFGTLYVIVNCVLLLFAMCFNRRCIGLGTIINLFFLGYIAQFTYDKLQLLIPVPSVLLRAVILLGSLIALCFGASVYMTADMGVSTYDAVAITMAEKWKLGQFRFIRIATDFACVALGVLCFMLGGGSWDSIGIVAGVGTIITAFFMGPLISFFSNKVSRPFLEH